MVQALGIAGLHETYGVAGRMGICRQLALLASQVITSDTHVRRVFYLMFGLIADGADPLVRLFSVFWKRHYCDLYSPLFPRRSWVRIRLYLIWLECSSRSGCPGGPGGGGGPRTRSVGGNCEGFYSLLIGFDF